MKKLLLLLVAILTSINLVKAQCDLNFDYVNTGSNMTAFFTPPAASAIHAELGDGTIGSFYTDADGSLICAASAAFNGAQIQLAVMADDSTSPDKDGFSSGESIKWFYQPADGSIFSISPSPNENFTINGISFIQSSSISAIDCGGDDTTSDDECPPLDFNFLNTGSNMTIGIPVDAWENLPEEGDEIAAYSTNGMLVGSVTYTGEATALTVWGDDITTDEVEGLLEGEEISFELWRKSEDKIEELTIQKWVEGGNVYSINGIAIAGDISSEVAGLGYELYPNVPNPFGSVTSISFFTPEEGDVKIGIYDMLGNLVKELTNESYNPGMYMLEFRSEDVSAGTYFVRMTAKGFSVTNTMSVVK